MKRITENDKKDGNNYREFWEGWEKLWRIMRRMRKIIEKDEKDEKNYREWWEGWEDS